MESVSATSLLAPSRAAREPNSFADLQGEDFFKLLITQLTNQDPLEPTTNQELFEQISSILDIELSTTLTQSLETLTGQQRFSSAASLIGQYVTAQPGNDGVAESGLVVGVRFTEAGQPILRLSSGVEIPVEQVSTIEPPIRAAEVLVGQAIVGIDQRDPTDPQAVEGVVTAVRTDEQGEVLLELDSGQDLRFRDIVSVTSVDTI